MPGDTNELVYRILALITRYFFTPSTVKPKLPPGQTIRFGLISAALINPPAMHYPSLYFPEVEIIAVAARDKSKAVEYAKRWGIKEEKAYGGYQALLDDGDVDAVFIGLPNGLHAEWAIKALQAGKHVLCEKPATSNAIEAREIRRILHSLPQNPSQPVFLEAFHYRFHPATVYFRNLLSSGTYGKLLNTYVSMSIPAGSLDPKNIRYSFELGGGALMDLTYVVSITRYMVLGAGAGKPKEIVSANAKKLPSDERIDTRMEAEMIFDVDDGQGGMGEVRSKIVADLERDRLFGFIPRIWEQALFIAECEKATVTYNNFIAPYMSHSIVIKPKEGKCRTEKVYTFDPTNKSPLLTNYGHQLDAFIKKVQGREEDIPADWIPIEDTVAQMEVIDAIYEKAGMEVRTGSLYQEILRRGDAADASK
ncbi:NAD binding oxidoreductase [Terfezia boudieri ATCC MYA-4762]|uniref:D-xylose 1-dehydrogenase (NADP(+), D-xylono-1,5-lactone-forming) n=1 Tax=Terfezia boudieri ATCC MYA-4762 TaxID=1051890 RepID=A0A3N4LNJ5_9PEZI|nr:NAD binding oxidoreductase [Terfezia boudieri ATCC MYA-4762]